MRARRGCGVRVPQSAIGIFDFKESDGRKDIYWIIDLRIVGVELIRLSFLQYRSNAILFLGIGICRNGEGHDRAKDSASKTRDC